MGGRRTRRALASCPTSRVSSSVGPAAVEGWPSGEPGGCHRGGGPRGARSGSPEPPPHETKDDVDEARGSPSPPGAAAALLLAGCAASDGGGSGGGGPARSPSPTSPGRPGRAGSTRSTRASTSCPSGSSTSRSSTSTPLQNNAETPMLAESYKWNADKTVAHLHDPRRREVERREADDGRRRRLHVQPAEEQPGARHQRPVVLGAQERHGDRQQGRASPSTAPRRRTSTTSPATPRSCPSTSGAPARPPRTR